MEELTEENIGTLTMDKQQELFDMIGNQDYESDNSMEAEVMWDGIHQERKKSLYSNAINLNCQPRTCFDQISDASMSDSFSDDGYIPCPKAERKNRVMKDDRKRQITAMKDNIMYTVPTPGILKKKNGGMHMNTQRNIMHQEGAEHAYEDSIVARGPLLEKQKGDLFQKKEIRNHRNHNIDDLTQRPIDTELDYAFQYAGMNNNARHQLGNVYHNALLPKGNVMISSNMLKQRRQQKKTQYRYAQQKEFDKNAIPDKVRQEQQLMAKNFKYYDDMQSGDVEGFGLYGDTYGPFENFQKYARPNVDMLDNKMDGKISRKDATMTTYAGNSTQREQTNTKHNLMMETHLRGNKREHLQQASGPNIENTMARINNNIETFQRRFGNEVTATNVQQSVCDNKSMTNNRQSERNLSDKHTLHHITFATENNQRPMQHCEVTKQKTIMNNTSNTTITKDNFIRPEIDNHTQHMHIHATAQPGLQYEMNSIRPYNEKIKDRTLTFSGTQTQANISKLSANNQQFHGKDRTMTSNRAGNNHNETTNRPLTQLMERQTNKNDTMHTTQHPTQHIKNQNTINQREYDHFKGNTNTNYTPVSQVEYDKGRLTNSEHNLRDKSFNTSYVPQTSGDNASNIRVFKSGNGRRDTLTSISQRIGQYDQQQHMPHVNPDFDLQGNDITTLGGAAAPYFNEKQRTLHNTDLQTTKRHVKQNPNNTTLNTDCMMLRENQLDTNKNDIINNAGQQQSQISKIHMHDDIEMKERTQHNTQMPHTNIHYENNHLQKQHERQFKQEKGQRATMTQSHIDVNFLRNGQTRSNKLEFDYRQGQQNQPFFKPLLDTQYDKTQQNEKTNPYINMAIVPQNMEMCHRQYDTVEKMSIVGNDRDQFMMENLRTRDAYDMRQKLGYEERGVTRDDMYSTRPRSDVQQSKKNNIRQRASIAFDGGMLQLLNSNDTGKNNKSQRENTFVPQPNEIFFDSCAGRTETLKDMYLVPSNTDVKDKTTCLTMSRHYSGLNNPINVPGTMPLGELLGRK